MAFFLLISLPVSFSWGAIPLHPEPNLGILVLDAYYCFMIYQSSDSTVLGIHGPINLLFFIDY